jgi:hypothetical protein
MQPDEETEIPLDRCRQINYVTYDKIYGTSTLQQTSCIFKTLLYRSPCSCNIDNLSAEEIILR